MTQDLYLHKMLGASGVTSGQLVGGIHIDSSGTVIAPRASFTNVSGVVASVSGFATLVDISSMVTQVQISSMITSVSGGIFAANLPTLSGQVLTYNVDGTYSGYIAWV